MMKQPMAPTVAVAVAIGLAVAVAVGLAGCGGGGSGPGSGATGGGGAPGGGGAGSGGNGGGMVGGGTGGTGGGGNAGSGGGSGGTGGSGGGDHTASVSMTPFTVPAGTEMFKCQSFANFFGGVDAEVTSWDIHLSPGSHHSFLFFDSATSDGPLQDCSGLTIAPFAAATQQPESTLTLP